MLSKEFVLDAVKILNQKKINYIKLHKDSLTYSDDFDSITTDEELKEIINNLSKDNFSIRTNKNKVALEENASEEKVNDNENLSSLDDINKMDKVILSNGYECIYLGKKVSKSQNLLTNDINGFQLWFEKEDNKEKFTLPIEIIDGSIIQRREYNVNAPQEDYIDSNILELLEMFENKYIGDILFFNGKIIINDEDEIDTKEMLESFIKRNKVREFEIKNIKFIAGINNGDTLDLNNQKYIFVKNNEKENTVDLLDKNNKKWTFPYEIIIKSYMTRKTYE